MRPVALGQHARSALLALFVVSPLAREGGRRSATTLCMASKSDPALPGWTTVVNQSIKKNDVAHKNFGVCVFSCLCGPARGISLQLCLGYCKCRVGWINEYPLPNR